MQAEYRVENEQNVKNRSVNILLFKHLINTGFSFGGGRGRKWVAVVFGMFFGKSASCLI